MYPINNPTAQLQATLSAASADNSLPSVMPHSPITCSSKLFFYEDNSFGCEHVTVPPDDKRTQAILRHSIALLIIELAFQNL